MTKFHVNGKGEPGPCRAGKSGEGKGCPFGDSSEHYDSKEAAREAYEGKMEAKAVPAGAKSSTSEETVPVRSPEVTKARKFLIESGDLNSYVFSPERSSKRLAEETGMKQEDLRAAIDEFIREDEIEAEAKFARSQTRAREVASNTDPDVSKIRKGAVVAFKYDESMLITVKVSSHRAGKISGNSSNGEYIDGWDDSTILTSDSKLD